MNVERAREILDPEHRENYDGMEAVNEACRMGRDALGKLVPLRPYREIGMVVDKLTREKMISLHTDALMPGERKGKQIWDTGVTARNMRSGPVTT